MILFGLVIFMVMILNLRGCELFRIFMFILLGFRRILCIVRDIIRLRGFLIDVMMICFDGKDLWNLKVRCDHLVDCGFEEELKDVVFDCFVVVYFTERRLTWLLKIFASSCPLLRTFNMQKDFEMEDKVFTDVMLCP